MGIVGLADVVDGVLEPAVTISPYQKHARLSFTVQELYDLAYANEDGGSSVIVEGIADKTIIVHTVSLHTAGDGSVTPFTNPQFMAIRLKYRNHQGTYITAAMTGDNWFPSGSGSGLRYSTGSVFEGGIDYSASNVAGEPVVVSLGALGGPGQNLSSTARFVFDVFYTVI